MREGPRLGILERGVEQRQQAMVQLELAQQRARTRRALPGEQQLQDLLEEARLRDVLEQMALSARIGSARLRVDLEAQLRREARGAKHAHRILAVARRRVADHHELASP